MSSAVWSSQLFWASVLLAVAMVSTGGLGIFVFSRNRKRLTHQLFFALMMNLSLWAGGVLAVVHSTSVPTATNFITLTFIVACFLPATFYHFVSEFPHPREGAWRWGLYVLYGGGVFLALMAFTPYHIEYVEIFEDAAPHAVYGWVLNAYSFLIVASMGFTFYDLIAKLRVARDIERRQVQYVLLGIFLTTVFATITNVVAPVLGVGSLEIYGPTFTVLMAGTFAYAMVRYHLLDVWILVSRATVYGTITAFVTVIFFASVSAIHYMSLNETLGGSAISSLVAAVLVVLLIQPVKEYVQVAVERTLLRRHYDDGLLVERIIRLATETVQLETLLRSVAEELSSSLGVARLRIFLTGENDEAHMVQAYPEEGEGHTFSDAECTQLIQYIRAHHAPVSPQEIRYHWSEAKHEAIASLLEGCGAQIFIPLRSKSGPVGMILLGEKLSLEMYSQQDHHVFRSIAGAMATAVENARLYDRLEKVNLHLEQIMQSMRAGVVAVDHRGTVTTVNEEARNMLGHVWPGETLEQMPLRVAQMLRRTLDEGRGIGDVETVIAGPEGELIPLAMSTSYFLTAANEPAGALVLLFNLTQIKRLESSVARADRLTSIGTMAAGMAHEIKNPLQSIKTFTQLLTKRYADSDFRKTFSEVVPPEVQRIDDIVTRLLDFARPKPVEFRPQDLEQIVRDVLALMHNQLMKYNVEVKAAFPPEGRLVQGDGQQLKQVFLNLFLNALDAMKEAHERTLTIRVHYGYCHVRNREDGSLEERPCAKVSLSDTGCGIPSEDLRQLFNPFFTTKAHGSGLGLSVVHSIITEHGGEIDVTSAPGVGATFFLVLPLAPTGILERANA